MDLVVSLAENGNFREAASLLNKNLKNGRIAKHFLQSCSTMKCMTICILGLCGQYSMQYLKTARFSREKRRRWSDCWMIYDHLTC